MRHKSAHTKALLDQIQQRFLLSGVRFAFLLRTHRVPRPVVNLAPLHSPCPAFFPKDSKPSKRLPRAVCVRYTRHSPTIGSAFVKVK
ncbi:hypothetical protein H3V53_02850 [Paraburkholderia bengalensis]|uniref:Uncharacterized protein n=1 Tax=Paraburkholderia bengalensis TaxID=2747562 RepID=A0ABU8IKR8_9BURK